MLKMKRSKRKASDRRVTNFNQKYSTVPWNDAVEVGEMVTMDHGGTSGGLDEDGEQLDYLEVARLLREKLNDFVEGGEGEPPGLELRGLLNMAASRKIVSMDPEMLNPILPKELLLLVFARLPVPDITRLRSLSKDWNRAMTTVNSEINLALDETNTTMVAAFSWDGAFPKSEFLVTICTQRLHYSYRLHPGNPIIPEDGWHDMGARDGGLVCFASTWRPSKANPLCIVVVNLLTRVRRKLPPLQYVYLNPPKMMHIKVDSETKCYRVVVVDDCWQGRSTVEIYDSGARQWTKATPPFGSIFGLSHSWKYSYSYKNFHDTDLTQSVFDFAERRLKCCDELGPAGGASVITYAHHQDYMFVLHRNTSNGEMLPAKGYCITKYCMQNNAKDWVQERSYPCSLFQDLLEIYYLMFLISSCEGFLMVYMGNMGPYWLLDLSTGEWSSLPNCFEVHRFGPSISQAFWNVVP